LNFRTNQYDYFCQPLTIQREHRNFSILHCSSSACKARYCVGIYWQAEQESC